MNQVIDTCDHRHKFSKLEDHPRNSLGHSVCPHCLMIGMRAARNENLALLEVLSNIQQACIGEIAMGYKLDAEYIGRSISKATGLTAPELLNKLREADKDYE